MGEGRRRKLAQEQRLAQRDSLPPSQWPLSDARRQGQLEEDFKRLGIDFSTPGFHDSPPFLAAEAQRAEMLDDYARYVEVRTYTEPELADARRKIEIAAEVVSAAVEQDGRMGKCVVASGILCRILDELGVWNFCAKATLSVTFPPELAGQRRFFHAIDEGVFEAPHAIVVAPPFLVVDTTAAAQSYDVPEMTSALPKLIMQPEFIPYQWIDEDIAAPQARARFASRGHSVRQHLQRHNPYMLKRMTDFPGRRVDFAGGTLAYVITGVGGYAEQLRDLIDPNCQLAGKTALSLFEDQIRPRLAAHGFGATTM